MTDEELREMQIAKATGSGGFNKKAFEEAVAAKRFQKKVSSHVSDMGSQLDAQRIKAGPTGKVIQDQVSAPEVTGPTSQAAGPAIQNAAGNMAIGAASNAVSDGIDQGGTTTSSSAGAAGGAMKGATAALATGNPYAIAGGAILGGVTGALSAKSNRKKKEAEAQAKMHQELGRIEGEKTDRLNKALSGLADNFSRTLV